MGAGGLDGVRQSAPKPFLQNQAVHHQIDGMLLVLLRLDLLRQVVEDSIHTNPGKTLLSGVLKHLLVFALLPPNHRGQDDKSGSLSQGLHPIHNLVNGLAANLLAALGTVRNAHPGPEQPEVVVNLRHRANGGAGVAGGGFLIDGNGRGQSVNGIHIRLVHLPQELPRIGAEALHIPPLALGVNGIKGQAGFTGTGQAGKYHQLVPGNGQIHIFQVVLSGALDNDFVVHG